MLPIRTLRCVLLTCLLPPVVLLSILLGASLSMAQEASGEAGPDQVEEVQQVARQATGLRVGGYVQNVDPRQFPVPVNGGFVQQLANRVIDPLAARSLVIEGGAIKISLTVVDSCLLPRDLVDAAKAIASQQTGIPVEQMMVSATHAHSVPAVQGIHGSEASETYRQQLTQQLADSIIEANRRLRPAEVGWARQSLDRFVYCRRWLMKPGTALTIPFTGRDSNQVQMNPGHGNANRVRKVGPVDTDVMVLAFRAPESGKPLAVLGNFNTHYAGAPAISSDYFGHFCRKIGARLDQQVDEQFVALMSNGTSGDANCIDFSQDKAVPFDAAEVADAVMEKATVAYKSINNWSQQLPLAMTQQELTLAVRMPSDAEVEKAREVTASWLHERLPQNVHEVYARETILLSELPTTRVAVLQTLRIGDFAITAAPCEIYGSTGLHLKSHSPFPDTMNIGWANDYLGYLPPPEHFELGGYTTWRARSSCLEENAEPKLRGKLLEMLNQLHQQPAPAQQAPAQPQQVQRQQAFPPQLAVGLFNSIPGVDVQLVASEPQVVDPVSVAFDAAGRMWVVEMRDYPTGPSSAADFGGRIKVLQDLDGDHHYETATTFADCLEFPTGVMPFRNGVVVTHAGRVTWMADADGDLKCDIQRDLFSGFAEENEQLRANHPTWTLENTIHVASGLRGGQITSVDGRWPATSQPVALAARDFEFQPDGGRYQAVAGNSQFGFFQDSLGNRFVCSNRNPAKVILAASDRVAANPLLPQDHWIVDVIPAAEASQVFSLTEAWTTSNLHAGQFTAACGVFRYESDLLAADFEHDFFVCEPTASAVCRYRTTSFGLVPTTKREHPGREFLASTDPWFRPVDLTDGPDGAIYVVDMHRAVIEHPQWVPDAWKASIDKRWGDQAGRIYRLVPSGTSQPTTDSTLKSMSLENAEPRELISQLGNKNRWRRNTSARLLYERANDGESQVREQIVGALRQYVRECVMKSQTTASGGTSQALWLLAASDALDQQTLLNAFSDEHPAVRRQAVKLARGRASAPVAPLLDRCSDDTDSGVRFEWLVQFAEAATAPQLARWVRRSSRELVQDKDSMWLADGLSLASPRQLPAVLAELATSPGLPVAQQPALLDLLGPWVERAGWEAEPQVLVAILDSQAELFSDSSLGDFLLARYVSGMNRRGRSMANLLDKLPESLPESLTEPFAGAEFPRAAWVAAQRRAVPLAGDPRRTSVERERALTLALAGDDQLASELCMQVLREYPAEYHASAIQRLARLDDADTAKTLLDQFSDLPTASIHLLIAAMARGDAWGEMLVESISSGGLPVGYIDPVSWGLLKRHANPEVRNLASEISEKIESSDRGKLTATYLAAMKTGSAAGDLAAGALAAGRQLFAQHCAACHRIGGVGHDVGPNISDLRIETEAELITAILNPNMAIDADYFAYTMLTTDGRIFEGRLLDTNPATVTLVIQNGETQTLDREQIESLQATGRSLMPEGFEQQLTPPQMTDLVNYLKNWRIRD
ncbi:PVC-type heme-binding CxxCH protein [Planctomycetaceae bacterium SH139]